MEYQLFVNWLENNRQMKTRSARDVLSRLKRVVNMLDSYSVDEDTISKLSSSNEFIGCSMFIKSQLKRAIKLYLEFLDSTIIEQ